MCMTTKVIFVSYSSLCLNQSSANLDQYAFQYKYDGRNRCIWKKLPGAGYMEMVYDNADRLVFSQDGNQRALTSGNWTYYKYDGLNRLTEQGTCTNKVTTSGTNVLVQHFYDSYAFRSQAGSITAISLMMLRAMERCLDCKCGNGTW